MNIAKISGTHHLKGAVKALSIFEELKLLKGQKVMLEERKSKDRKVVTIDTIDRMNHKRILIKFEEINSVSEARMIDGYNLMIRREVLGVRSKDEYYLSDLIDMIVETTDGKVLGPVRDVFTTAAHEIYVINEGKEEIMIPAVPEFIKDLDFDNDKIIVELIDGML